ncbi:hypothetical protein [Streptomyces sp. NPDC058664]|uniref:hypothetical protein n=1 Tax=unclassified Streptomyces TaxID=2593676 RepID=UPI0036479F9B
MEGKKRLEHLRTGAERRFPFLSELTGRLLTANLLDAGTRLAAQAFLASVPLLFAVAAFAPLGVRDQLRESLRTMFGLSGESDQELRKVLYGSADDALRETTGAVGAVVALVSATSFSRAMARVCERAWGLPRAKSRVAAWRWVVWLLAMLLVIVLQGPIRNGFGAGLLVGTPLFFLLATGVWLWTQHLFLRTRAGSSIATTTAGLPRWTTGTRAVSGGRPPPSGEEVPVPGGYVWSMTVRSRSPTARARPPPVTACRSEASRCGTITESTRTRPTAKVTLARGTSSSCTWLRATSA